MGKPVIEDHSGLVGTFATVAERRMVITQKKFETSAKDHPDNPGYVSLFCAEPPPDSTQSIASSLTAALKAEASQGNNKQGIDAGTAQALITTARSMFTRSQGIQLFRDGVYNLCQAHLNGAIKADEYSTNFNNLLLISGGLIQKEIEKGPPSEVVRALATDDAGARAKESAAQLEIARNLAALEAIRKSSAPAQSEAPAPTTDTAKPVAKPKETADTPAKTAPADKAGEK